MIEVIYNEREHCLCVHGHAGYAARGQDVVCAAVSGICEALVGACIDRREKVMPVIGQRESEARLRVKLYPEGERNRSAARLILDMAYIGMERIETQCPEYVHCTRTKEEI